MRNAKWDDLRPAELEQHQREHEEQQAIAKAQLEARLAEVAETPSPPTPALTPNSDLAPIQVGEKGVMLDASGFDQDGKSQADLEVDMSIISTHCTVSTDSRAPLNPLYSWTVGGDDGLTLTLTLIELDGL